MWVRLPLWVGGLTIGFIWGLLFSDWALWVPVACVLACGLWLLRRKWPILAVGTLASAGGAVWAAQQQRELVSHIRAVEGLVPDQEVCVTGEVQQVMPGEAEGRRLLVKGGLTTSFLQGRWRVLLKPTPKTSNGTSASGDELLPGDTLTVCGAWSPPFAFFNPGARDPWMQLALRRDAGSMRAGKVVQTRSGVAWHPRRIAHRARRALSAALAALPPERAALLRATVLGERSDVAPEVERGFKAAGATHALSVSGLHLAAVAVLFFVGLRRALLLCPALALRLPPRQLAAAASIPAVLFYTLLTGEAVATWRSAVMATTMFAAYVCRRTPSLACSLALACAGITLHSVFWLCDISFQLSFLSVASLAVFAGPLGASASQNASPVARMVEWVRRSFVATAAAGLLTGPLVAHEFGEITPAAPLGNLVLTPVVELLVVPVGLLAATVAALDPRLGKVPLYLADLAARFALHVAQQFDRYAPIWYVNNPSPLETFTYTFAFICALGALVKGAPSPVLARRLGMVAVSLVLLTQGLRELRLWRRTHSNRVTVTFLDVGQGDAAVVQGPGGFVAVIDAGGIGGTFDTGARIVGPFLRRQGIDRIDVLALSHPHPDHAEGMAHLLERFGVSRLWMPVSELGPDQDGAIIRKLRTLASKYKTAVAAPTTVKIGGMSLVPLGPWVGDLIAAPVGLSVNDASLSLRLQYGAQSILFAGDLEGPGELELSDRAQQGFGVKSAILKTPHHGSRTSSSHELLEAVAPTYAVVSAGWGNRYGFPHHEVLRRYSERGIRVLRTDLNGAVRVEWGLQESPSFSCVRSRSACR